MTISQRKIVPYERSLEYWAKTNNKEFLLNEFSNKNKKLPNEIYKSTKDTFLWNCPKCKSEYLMSVDSRTNKKRTCNCPYCAGKRVNHTNCLWATHPEIAKLLVNEEVGYSVMGQSNKKADFKCSQCGYIVKDKFIYQIVNQGLSCPICSDGVSYPQKFISNLLNQINIHFLTEHIFDWSKNVELKNKNHNGTKKYDFYIPSLNMIIETHGGQHYKETNRGRSLEYEKENDRLKEKLAKENGINNYIVIDCRKSELEYIINSINNSEITKLFDLSSIDWNKCHKYACNSLVKTACDLWNNGVKSTVKIGAIMHLSFNVIIKYLKQGTTIGWCNYDPKEVQKNNGYSHIGKKYDKKWGKAVIMLNLDGKYINEFTSATEAGKILNITSSHISSVCNGKRKTSGGYLWIYKKDYEVNHFE